MTKNTIKPAWEIQRLHGNRVSSSEHRSFSANVEVPESFDWREKGAITRVKDQLHCGSCWAFSATGALEAAHFIKTGRLVELSEQNLFDCATEAAGYDDGDCIEGGRFDEAFRYVEDHGIDTEAAYPYVEGKNPFLNETCKFDNASVATTAVGHFRLPNGDEERLKVAVATVGTVSVAINAHHIGWKHYVGDGVYYEEDCPCGNKDITHAVLVVGYGTQDDGGDYWIVKNSWGETYGNRGYIKMARNRNNNCCIATLPTLPVVAA